MLRMRSSPILFRRKLWKLYYGFRLIHLLYSIPLYMLLVWVSWRTSPSFGSTLRVPSPPDHDLSHFRRSRSLRHYLDDIELLIEPSSLPCTNLEEVPVLVLVASSPSQWDNRHAIRSTWGKHFPTYFILGLDGVRNDDQLIENYVEAKQYGDMVVYEFKESYQNLTLKTALMLKWTLDKCPQTQFFFKVDDDVVINPWVLKDVLKDNADAQIVGYVNNNSWLNRDVYNKYYLPRWLNKDDVISQYVSGSAYLINGDIISDILKTAYKVPLHNLEDVYFTYNVARKTLGYKLTHEPRLSSYRPFPGWLPISCAYWNYASIHGFKPSEMLSTWSYIQDIAPRYLNGEPVCSFYNTFVKGFISTY